jgi:hypothetical protein
MMNLVKFALSCLVLAGTVSVQAADRPWQDSLQRFQAPAELSRTEILNRHFAAVAFAPAVQPIIHRPASSLPLQSMTYQGRFCKVVAGRCLNY